MMIIFIVNMPKPNDVTKLLLSSQQSKKQNLSIYAHKWQKQQILKKQEAAALIAELWQL